MAKATQKIEPKVIGKVGQLRVLSWPTKTGDSPPCLELPIGQKSTFSIGVSKLTAILACEPTVKAFLAQFGQPKPVAVLTPAENNEMANLRAEIAALKSAKAGRVDAIAA